MASRTSNKRPATKPTSKPGNKPPTLPTSHLSSLPKAQKQVLLSHYSQRRKRLASQIKEVDSILAQLRA